MTDDIRDAIAAATDSLAARDHAAIKSAIDTAEGAIRALYRNDGQECHPALRARFDADMDVIIRARAAYAAIMVRLSAFDAVAAAPAAPEEESAVMPMSKRLSARDLRAAARDGDSTILDPRD